MMESLVASMAAAIAVVRLCKMFLLVSAARRARETGSCWLLTLLGCGRSVADLAGQVPVQRVQLHDDMSTACAASRLPVNVRDTGNPQERTSIAVE